MWYPNKAQWWVIWIVGVVAFLFLVNGVVGVALGLVVLGALLVWQLSKPHENAEQEESAEEADDSLQTFSEKSETGGDGPAVAGKSRCVFCVECGSRLEAAWKHCPFCGSAKL